MNEGEVGRTLQAEARAYRKVGELLETGESVESRRKVSEVCVLPEVTFGLESITKDQERMQVSKNNWVRKLCRVKLAERKQRED